MELPKPIPDTRTRDRRMRDRDARRLRSGRATATRRNKRYGYRAAKRAYGGRRAGMFTDRILRWTRDGEQLSGCAAFADHSEHQHQRRLDSPVVSGGREATSFALSTQQVSFIHFPSPEGRGWRSAPGQVERARHLTAQVRDL